MYNEHNYDHYNNMIMVIINILITTLIPIIRGFKMGRNPIILPKAVHLETTEFIFIYIMYVRTYIHTYIFVVVNFDALAQASDFRIERRQVVFLCGMQDSNPGGL